MSATAPPIRLSLSAEVRDFALKFGLLPYLPALAEITEQVFAEARVLTAEVHDDPDVAGLRWVIFRAEVPWAEPDQVRSARDAWYARTAATCPPPVLAHVGLDIDRRPE